MDCRRSEPDFQQTTAQEPYAHCLSATYDSHCHLLLGCCPALQAPSGSVIADGIGSRLRHEVKEVWQELTLKLTALTSNSSGVLCLTFPSSNHSISAALAADSLPPSSLSPAVTSSAVLPEHKAHLHRRELALMIEQLITAADTPELYQWWHGLELLATLKSFYCSQVKCFELNTTSLPDFELTLLVLLSAVSFEDRLELSNDAAVTAAGCETLDQEEEKKPEYSYPCFNLRFGFHPWFLRGNEAEYLDEVMKLVHLAAQLCPAQPCPAQPGPSLQAAASYGPGTDCFVKPEACLGLKETRVQFTGWGEIGLDRRRGGIELKAQMALLHTFLEATALEGYSCHFHCGNAYNELYQVVRRFPDMIGVLHGFNSKYEVARPFLARGFGLGLGRALLSELNESKFRRLMLNTRLSVLQLESDSDSSCYPDGLIAELAARAALLRATSAQ